MNHRIHIRLFFLTQFLQHDHHRIVFRVVYFVIQSADRAAYFFFFCVFENRSLSIARDVDFGTGEHGA